ncbi:MAG: hypothetical protein AAF513_02735 [Pseudomonadota bacterium]
MRAWATGQPWDTFRASGWRFFKGDADICDPKKSARRVYATKAGEVMIEGSSMTVKFADDVSQTNAQAVLSSYGLEVKRSLGFMNNGFQGTRSAESADLNMVEAASRLDENPQVEFAEPGMIEPMANR